MKNNLHANTSYISVFGDLFENIKKQQADIIIPHVVANTNGFNSGFAVAVERNYPIVKANYDLLTTYKLGEDQFIKIESGNKRNIVFVNMIAQNSNARRGKRQLNYLSLVKCMASIGTYIRNNYSEFDSNKIEIHAPKFGCGVSGGNWNFISDLIDDIWGDFATYIYTNRNSQKI
jgi:hypothetical protein